MINKKEYRFIISGGGSGGHIYPALSIADGLKNKFINSELLFVGSKNKMEMKIIPERGYRIKGLNISGFKRKFLILLNNEKSSNPENLYTSFMFLAVNSIKFVKSSVSKSPRM